MITELPYKLDESSILVSFASFKYRFWFTGDMNFVVRALSLIFQKEARNLFASLAVQ